MELRNVDVSQYELINQGGQGAIYRFDKDRVLKLYFAYGYDTVLQLESKEKILHEAGIPVLLSDEIVRCGDKFGVIKKYVTGKSLGECLMSDPADFENLARIYTDNIKKIHRCKGKHACLKDAKRNYFDRLQVIAQAGLISESEYSGFEKFLDRIPDTDNWLHGDPHARNFIPCNGDVLMVDLDVFGYGHHVFDLAQIYAYFVAMQNSPNVLKYIGVDSVKGEQLWKFFADRYFDIDDEDTISTIETELNYFSSIFRLILLSHRKDIAQDSDVKKHVQYIREQVLPNLDSVERVFEV